MNFGFEWRGRLNGAEAYVRIFQLSSLLPGLYILVAAGFMAVVTGNNLFSALFDLGLAAIPRWEAAALSALYRASGSETAVFFALVGAALALGLLAARLLREKRETARTGRYVFAGLIAADLVLRLLPLGINRALPVWAAAAGFAIRLGCLVMIWLDLRAEKKSRTGQD